MKRYVRPPPRDNSNSDADEEDNEDYIPPAKKLLKSLLQHEVDKAFQDLSNDAPITSRNNDHRAASLIPEFDPDSEDCTVVAWLKKIDQLGEIHDWDEKTKSFHLQAKLRGQARKWYNRLDDYNYTWPDWKQMLIRAFPKHRDYGNMLEELLRRRKLPSESMTKYYQEKVAMCFQCKLSDRASVSCIIRGLPLSLQANARAFQCERPDELYEGFLCALDDYRPPAYESRSFIKDSGMDKKPSSVNPEVDPCPRCRKTGHILRNCPQPDLRTCFKCGLQGHIATHCRSLSGNNNKYTTTPNQEVKEIKLVQDYNDIYKKLVKINDTFVKAYIDTGSQVNVLYKEVARILNLEITPTTVALKGFSGGVIESYGVVEFNLKVDDISLVCKAYLTNIEMQGINLLIGQPIINSKDMSLVVCNGTAILKTLENHDFTKKIDVAEELERFKVVTVTKEVLPPGPSIIKVHVLGNCKDNNVVTNSRHFEFQNISYSLPATILRGENGYLKVINTGTASVTWEPGVVLTRASVCEDLQSNSQYMHIEIHPSMSKQWFAADINREVTATGAHVDLAPDLIDSSLILWSRKVPQELISTSGQVELSEPKQSCGRALYVTPLNDIEGFVHQHTLASEIGGIKDMAGCKLTLIIFGTKDYFKLSNRTTKNSKQKLITNIDLEMAITDLLVSTQCDTILVNTPNELALNIVQFTKAIAEEPFKRAKRMADEQADFYMRGDNKNCVPLDQNGNGAMRVWQQMIAVLPSSSLEISRAVCAQYKTPRDLHNACKPLNCEKTIADIAVSRTAVPGAKTRRLGPEFASKLRTLFTSTNGSELLD